MTYTVRYYTKTGNTKRLADAIAKELGVEALTRPASPWTIRNSTARVSSRVFIRASRTRATWLPQFSSYSSTRADL